MTFSMSFMPAFMLPMCRSVEIESGRKPSLMSGTATRHAKLPPPWPTSKMMPRLRPSISARVRLAVAIQLVAQTGVQCV